MQASFFVYQTDNQSLLSLRVYIPASEEVPEEWVEAQENLDCLNTKSWGHHGTALWFRTKSNDLLDLVRLYVSHKEMFQLPPSLQHRQEHRQLLKQALAYAEEDQKKLAAQIEKDAEHGSAFSQLKDTALAQVRQTLEEINQYRQLFRLV
jgi:hypothetical protein